ncbi:unnamed protein product [Orchesella dallaii]|uniref:Uncharacterized protein n=1 Tax=Orchesella dallaii TaxID=48710 RepID=A0ABP1PX75_9HEXA
MEEGNSLRFDDTRHYAADLKTAQRFCLNLKLKAAQPQELREYIGTNIPPVKSINIKKNYPNFYTLHTENSVSEINHMLCPRHRNEFKVFESSNIKQPFTLFDSISLAMYGDSRIGDLLKVNFISYILTLQQTPLEIFESVCCDKYPLTVISKLVQLLATYLESDIIIWSSEEFLTKTTLFAARDKKRTQDAIGIAMLFAKTGVMCAIGKSAQMSGVTITHQSVCVQPNEYIIQQIIPNFGCENEDAHNNFPNSQYISHLEFHGGTFPEIKPMSVDSNWVSDPISHCSELETWFNMFGIAYVLVNKEQWKDIKPVTVVESRLASIPFFKQTVSRLGPSMMKMVHENKKKLTRKKMKQINKEMLHL